MDQDDLQEMNSALEQMLVCADLDDDHHELIERCLDEGIEETFLAGLVEASPTRISTSTIATRAIRIKISRLSPRALSQNGNVHIYPFWL